MRNAAATDATAAQTLPALARGSSVAFGVKVAVQRT